jgi:ferric-dicitrate binding protein FerR (iron transport regulator)
MSTSESTRALRRANPRTKAGFEQAVEAATEAVRERIADDHDLPPARSRSRPAFIGIAAGAALAAVAALVLLVGSLAAGPAWRTPLPRSRRQRRSRPRQRSDPVPRWFG